MKKLTINDGSFRDPDARVAHFNDSIYRIVYPSGFKKFDLIKKILQNQTIADYLIGTEEIGQEELKSLELDHQKDIKLRSQNLINESLS